MIINLFRLVELVIGGIQVLFLVIAVGLHVHAWAFIVQNYEQAKKNATPMTFIWVFGGLESVLCLASIVVILVGRL
jgi:hypothetical protein